MTWRLNLVNTLFANGLTDIYEFGVFSGESVWDIKNIYDHNNIPIRKFFGFDSFVGLPEETNEPIAQDCWHKGEFNACEKFSAKNVDECIEKTDKLVREKANWNGTDLIWIPGFYEDVLTDDIVEKYDMKPAIFVDMDADIYTSTYIALDFMFRNKLIQRGTFIAYDDWGGTPGWQTYADGESRAHNEICNKYRVNIQMVAQFGYSYPHVQMVFLVC
jgi:hypothetical protein